MRGLTVVRGALALRRLAAAGTAGAPAPVDRERLRRARAYNRTKERLYLLSVAASLVAGALVVFSGTAARIRTAVQRRAGWGLPGEAATGATYALLTWLAGLPLSYLSGYVVEHRYGLSNQSRAAWLGEQAKGLGVGLTLQIPLVAAGYATIRRWPRAWWAIVSAASIPLTVLLAQLGPVLIMPLFNRYEPLKDRELAERLKALAARSGIAVADVLQTDMSRQTKKANAFFAGLGRTRRIVLGDTLLEQFTPEEIEVIVAHEIAHQAHRDLWRLIALGSGFTVALSFLVDRLARATLRRYGHRIGTRRLDDIATMPLLAWILSLAGLILGPVQNWYSRRIERRADRFALELTRDPAAFGSAMTRLAAVNLSDPQPPALVRYLLSSHPSIAERIEHARRYAAEHDLPAPEPLTVG
ncbi:MAG: M48 family metallopeptidase [Sphaerobacter sp.]|nr:M48 family metallopeptidase [Sphaerobacter sp.]